MSPAVFPNEFFLGSRAPRRVTITIPYFIHEQLIKRSDEEGRSMSNLAAYLIERALEGCGSVDWCNEVRLAIALSISPLFNDSRWISLISINVVAVFFWKQLIGGSLSWSLVACIDRFDLRSWSFMVVARLFLWQFVVVMHLWLGVQFCGNYCYSSWDMRFVVISASWVNFS